jgi:hypothetical protein
MNAVKRKMDSSGALSAVVIDPFSGFKYKNDSVDQSFGHKSWILANKELIVLISLWYACAIVTITTTKEIMIRAQLPYLLCTTQFAFASILSFIVSKWNRTLIPPPESVRTLVQFVAVSYTFGFVLTNIAFSLGILLQILIFIFTCFKCVITQDRQHL